MIKHYKKKPVIIEAIQWDGSNYTELCRFVGVPLELDAGELLDEKPSRLLIPTLEGLSVANIYDYVIKGVKGEFYPCKPDIFKQIYEEV